MPDCKKSDGKKPDWKRMVRERISSPRALNEDVIAELASHLEETFDAARSQGLTEQAAIELALQDVADWRVLASKLRRAKSKEGPMNIHPMNSRTKTLWLPGMISLLGASLLLMTLQRTSFQPRLVWFGHMAMLFYWPWLAGLPVFGAVGAYLSRLAQGSTRARLAAGLAPALVLLAAFAVSLPVGLAVDGFSLFRLAYFCLAVTNWVILPGAALFAGAVPFLRESPEPDAQRSAT